MKKLHSSRGAAVVEYAMIWPVLMLLFFGALETFRLMSIKQSLRIGLADALPCITATLDEAAQGNCYALGIIEDRVAANPLAIRGANIALATSATSDDYGHVFEVQAEAEVALGFLYPFEGGPTITLRERRITFYGPDGHYYGMWQETPMPIGPGAMP